MVGGFGEGGYYLVLDILFAGGFAVVAHPDLGVEVLVAFPLAGIAYLVVPFLQDVGVLFHVIMVGPPLEALKVADAFCEDGINLLLEGLEVGL